MAGYRRGATPPELQRYEVANALARAVVAGQFPAPKVATAWQHITAVPITLHRLEEGPAVVAMTQRLERKSAYDAAYLVLADRLNAELWTFDGPLARNAASRGLAVQLIEAETTSDEGEMSNARQTNGDDQAGTERNRRGEPGEDPA